MRHIKLKTRIGNWVDKNVLPLFNSAYILDDEKESSDDEHKPQYLDALTEMESRYKRSHKLKVIPDISTNKEDVPDYFQFFVRNYYVGTIEKIGLVKKSFDFEETISGYSNQLIIENIMKEGVSKLYNKSSFTLENHLK